MFAQPAKVEIELPASGPASLGVAGVQRRTMGGRRGTDTVVGGRQAYVSGQLNHFSELAMLDAALDMSLTTGLQPREIAVGGELVVNTTVTKSASPYAAVVEEPTYKTSADIEFVSMQSSGELLLPANAAAQYAVTRHYVCLREHSGAVYVYARIWIELDLPLLQYVAADERREEPYVCKGPPPGTEDKVRTGVFPLPLGMQQPDGLQLVQRAFAGLTGNTVHALIAGSNGVVGIDLKTGAVSLDQTPTGADGALGNGSLLGVTAVSQPNPGATTHAALFGAGALGSAVRSFVQFNNGAWGWSQILLLGQVLQWASSGGGLEADEVLGARPGVGLVAHRFDGVAYRQSAEGSVDAFRFDGKLVAAAVPLNLAGSPVLVATHTDGDTTTSVWHHDRSRTPGTLLFKVPGVAKVLRCMDQVLSTAFGSRRLCGLTTAEQLHYFLYDTQDPAAVPSVGSVPVGPGAVGVQFGLRAAGNPWTAVANFDGHSLDIVDYNAAGQVLDQQKVTVPAGCLNPGHAAPFNEGGKDCVAGTCYGSGHYFVFERPRF